MAKNAIRYYISIHINLKFFCYIFIQVLITHILSNMMLDLLLAVKRVKVDSKSVDLKYVINLDLSLIVVSENIQVKIW